MTKNCLNKAILLISESGNQNNPHHNKILLRATTFLENLTSDIDDHDNPDDNEFWISFGTRSESTDDAIQERDPSRM